MKWEIIATIDDMKEKIWGFPKEAIPMISKNLADLFEDLNKLERLVKKDG